MVCKCLLDVVSLREDVLIPVPMVPECNYKIVIFVTETGKDQFTKLFMKK